MYSGQLSLHCVHTSPFLSSVLTLTSSLKQLQLSTAAAALCAQRRAPDGLSSEAFSLSSARDSSNANKRDELEKNNNQRTNPCPRKTSSAIHKTDDHARLGYGCRAADLPSPLNETVGWSTFISTPLNSEP